MTSKAILRLIYAAHHAEQAANIYDHAREFDAAQSARDEAEDIRHAIELLTTHRQEWQVELEEIAAVRGITLDESQLEQIGGSYIENLTPDEAFREWLEAQPVNDP